MVSLSNLAESSWFESDECEEISSSTCVVLQSSMVRGWAKVLRRRAVAHLGATKASCHRAVRLLRMAERRNLALSGGDRVLVPSLDRVVSSFPQVSYNSGSGDDSEDEPLSRRISAPLGFRSSTFDAPEGSVGSVEEVDSGEGGSSGSDESEQEDASEEDSETESEEDSDDDLIYMGRESALSNSRSQALLSRWELPMVVAEEV